MALSLSSSGEPSCCGETELDRHMHNEDESDEESPIIFITSESRCEQLYHRGLEMQYRSDLEGALSSFLKCLEGMQKCEYFAKLPQTLHQLCEVYKSLNFTDKAEEYARAEKLFYEVVVTESPRPAGAKEGGAKSKTRRKPFSKKPKPVTSSVCNPAEYFPVLTKRAEEFDRLSRAYYDEGRFYLALDHCSKAATIRGCIYGQNHPLTRASLDFHRLLSIHVGANNCQSDFNTSTSLEGDLSSVRPVNGCEIDGSPQSALCGGAQTALSTTSTNNGVSHQPRYTVNNSDHLLQSKGSTTQIGNTLYTEENSQRSLRYPRTLSPAGVAEETLLPGVVSGEASKQEETSKQDNESVQLGNKECGINAIQEAGRQDKVGSTSRQDLTIWGRVQEKVADARPLQEIKINVYTGVRNNLSKLSEIKTPLCVNLGPHIGAGEDVAQTRCLPLWVLLFPAFLALLAYMFYYH